ncbi:MAG: tRNA1(Val) (adenine(37)-N6)-methyltransferase [Firmicutes bacterium ADurb.Bin193]|nr:MAG: tRNA1(Val) (adenine(37)-N6)-methyltransferase [Firmicutes bacterium ADurb.Bin193]
MRNVPINDKERIDDLQVPLKNGKSLCVIQNPDYFCFGVDAVLLADFAKIPKNAVVADMGCGCGVIPLLIAAKTEASHITGIEIQSEVAEMAQRSVALNGLEDKISVINADIKRFEGSGVFDVITCNPPYKEGGGGLKNPNKYLAVARHEVCCTLSDVIKTAARLLKPGGKLNIIHRPERLADIICGMRKNGLEPKRIRFVHPAPYKTATMVLIEGAKGGRPKLFSEPPLYIHDQNGEYSDEINRIYGKTKDKPE